MERGLLCFKLVESMEGHFVNIYNNFNCAYPPSLTLILLGIYQH